MLAAIAAVSLWTPAAIAHRWFDGTHLQMLSPVPIATACAAWIGWRRLDSDSEAGPFLGTIALFVLSYLGIAISMWPMIVPRHYTLWEAASSPSTQAFLLIGTLFLLSIILGYSAWSYWVFRGKVRAGK